MFSGKTEELIRRLRRAELARQSVQVFKPAVDDRYCLDAVVTHSAQRFLAVPTTTSQKLFECVAPETQVVGIDEVQFFDRKISNVADELASRGVRVIVAGLDTDYLGEPFGPVPEMLARAEYVTKLLAICVRCGRPANRSLRVVGGTAQVEVGASERYEAVCRSCHERALYSDVNRDVHPD